MLVPAMYIYAWNTVQRNYTPHCILRTPSCAKDSNPYIAYPGAMSAISPEKKMTRKKSHPTMDE
jgi:hypothetical protein